MQHVYAQALKHLIVILIPHIEFSSFGGGVKEPRSSSYSRQASSHFAYWRWYDHTDLCYYVITPYFPGPIQEYQCVILKLLLELAMVYLKLNCNTLTHSLYHINSYIYII